MVDIDINNLEKEQYKILFLYIAIFISLGLISIFREKTLELITIIVISLVVFILFTIKIFRRKSVARTYLKEHPVIGFLYAFCTGLILTLSGIYIAFYFTSSGQEDIIFNALFATIFILTLVFVLLDSFASVENRKITKIVARDELYKYLEERLAKLRIKKMKIPPTGSLEKFDFFITESRAGPVYGGKDYKEWLGGGKSKISRLNEEFKHLYQKISELNFEIQNE